MDVHTTAALLAYIQALDPRNMTPADDEDRRLRVMAWSQALPDDIAVEDAQGAVVAHYRESKWPITVADVIAHSRRVAKRRKWKERQARGMRVLSSEEAYERAQERNRLKREIAQQEWQAFQAQVIEQKGNNHGERANNHDHGKSDR